MAAKTVLDHCLAMKNSKNMHGNGNVSRRPFLLENKIAIRIRDRQPGHHVLAKQRLVRLNSDPFAVRNKNYQTLSAIARH
jgi:hypothetical protein